MARPLHDMARAGAGVFPRQLHTHVPKSGRLRQSQLLAKEFIRARSIPELVTMHGEYRAGIDPTHVPTIWHKLSVLGRTSEQRHWLRGHEPQLAQLCEHTVELLPAVGSNGLASTACSLARAGLSGPASAVLWAALDA